MIQMMKMRINMVDRYSVSNLKKKLKNKYIVLKLKINTATEATQATEATYSTNITR